MDRIAKAKHEFAAKHFYLEIQRLVAEHREPAIVSREELYDALRMMGDTPPVPASERYTGPARLLDGRRLIVTNAVVIGAIDGIAILDCEGVEKWVEV